MGVKDLFVKKESERGPKGSGSEDVPLSGTPTFTPSPPRSYLGDTSKLRRGQTIVSAPVASPTTVDQEFSDELETITKQVPSAKGFEGFLNSLETLATYITNERDRFKAALDTSKATGLTVQQINEGLKGRLQALEGHQQTFQAEIEQEVKESVADSEQRISGLDEQMASLEKQISELQDTFVNLSNERQKLQGQKSEVETQRAQVVSRFQSAYGFHRSRIQELLSKVQQYLE